ncbi:MAG TPA: hypothetical protein VF903_11005 [Nitrospirota bacterium]
MRERALGLIIFVITVAVLTVSIRLLNWLPGVFQEGLVRTYDSIEAVKSKLRIRDVYTPSYYPQGLRWPPTRITAQTKPYTMILLECTRQEDGLPSLVISQTALPHSAPQPEIRMLRRTERVHYPLKGRSALLDVGFCGNNEPCSRISWDESAYRIEVIMLAPPTEIVKIAESMVSE